MGPVHDLVFAWSDTVMTDKRPLVASVIDGSLILAVETDQGRMMSHVRLGDTVPHITGKLVTFKLFEIWPGVRKLNTSILTEWLHAYITIVGCPPVDDLDND